ncbi:reverse transcriptase N-terminal domain-containing protein [Saccharopolyspora spinosa]|uniref:reverse transcriptase N-terminal domain-containing protein n=1 Tax=Saccharopolyspora spinosa TaxID=60894 RepID=UPI0002379556
MRWGGGLTAEKRQTCLVGWSQADWDAAEGNVRRLRRRIFTVSQAGDLAKVRNLQELMLRFRPGSGSSPTDTSTGTGV